jgi:uncharacterized protein (AIM24 family)
MGDGSNPGAGFMDNLFSAGARMVAGESLFLTHFTNTSRDKRRVAFGAPYPGRIIPVDLSTVGGSVTCQRGVFLTTLSGTGKVWVQSLPFSRLAVRILSMLPRRG